MEGKTFQEEWSIAQLKSEMWLELRRRELWGKETKKEEPRLRVRKAGLNGWWEAGSWIVYSSQNPFVGARKGHHRGR